ncbi:hypothetical protein Bhyg_11198 [Pseudolycoriella hygida]|uniref:Uncharacterized protein n=1 Tax=Pseudolycoriella hygida TaxID=35572 RepID=A0A9Q0S021_9DIPT|nr:hypothetical protein Bhyg_11198 [Pseudolycoriella hygida]
MIVQKLTRPYETSANFQFQCSVNIFRVWKIKKKVFLYIGYTNLWYTDLNVVVASTYNICTLRTSEIQNLGCEIQLPIQLTFKCLDEGAGPLIPIFELDFCMIDTNP